MKILLSAAAAAADGWAAEVRITRVSCSLFGTLKWLRCRNVFTSYNGLWQTTKDRYFSYLISHDLPLKHLIEKRKTRRINMAKKIQTTTTKKKTIYF